MSGIGALRSERKYLDTADVPPCCTSSSWNGRLMLDLYDTNESEDINIAERLVERGFAMFVESTTDVSSTTSDSGTGPREIFVPG